MAVSVNSTNHTRLIELSKKLYINRAVQIKGNNRMGMPIESVRFNGRYVVMPGIMVTDVSNTTTILRNMRFFNALKVFFSLILLATGMTLFNGNRNVLVKYNNIRIITNDNRYHTHLNSN